ncbi:YraN family protein [Algirhabdus cladophorae]|uniref:YraN family protein n=1 Tax=Algirhabdus cladophorae TaxID=3377108 RepID=UPI003B846AE6
MSQSLTNYHAGLAAEDSVARHYLDAGYSLCASRWRGQSGEIDLVVQGASGLVFVEVKKSRSFEKAARALGARQQARIIGAAAEYLAAAYGTLDHEARFDLAVVDSTGTVQVAENAFGGL